jgi:hypothetical protein
LFQQGKDLAGHLQGKMELALHGVFRRRGDFTCKATRAKESNGDHGYF